MAKRREKGKIPHNEWPAIRMRYAAGESLASIARDYGCTGPAIRYIVNRPVGADGTAGIAALPAVQPDTQEVEAPETAGRFGAPERPPARRDEAPVLARPDRSGDGSDEAQGTSGIDPDLRWRVSSEIASFLAVFDSFLTDNSPETYDQLLSATDRLMRVAARTRIELERARTSEHSRLRQAQSTAGGQRPGIASA